MSEPSNEGRLFIGSLADQVSEDELRALFETVGEVISVSIKLDWNSGRSRGFGFVQLASDDEAQLAISALNGHELQGRSIRVMVAEPRGKAGDRGGPEVERKGAAVPAADPASESAASEGASSSGADDPSPAGAQLVEPVSPPVSAAAPPEQTAPDAPAGTPEPPLNTPAADDGRFSTRRLQLIWLTGLAVLITVAVTSYALLRWKPAVGADPATVLVLPLEVAGPDAGAPFAGEAFAQAVAVNLATAGGLQVLPVPQPSEVHADSSDARARLARRQGAGRLLVGTLTRRDDRVLAALTLVDAIQNRILWGTQREGRDSEVMAMAAALARELATELGGEAATQYAYVTDLLGSAALRAQPETAEAIGALRRGEFEPALRATRQLVSRFPADLMALALRAQALTLAWDARPSAESLAALNNGIDSLDCADPDAPYQDFYRAYIDFRLGRGVDAIIKLSTLLERRDLAPAARAWMLRYRGVARQVTGDMQAAMDDLDESLRLDPTNAWTLGILSSTLVDAGRLEEALTRARQGLALVPSYWRSHQALGYVLSAMDRRGEGAAAYRKACELGNVQLPCSLQVVTLQKAGQPDEARVAAEHAVQLTATPLGLYNLACYWALAGEPDRALPLLRRALGMGFAYTTVRDDPDLRSLHGLEEFENLVPAETHGAAPPSD